MANTKKAKNKLPVSFSDSVAAMFLKDAINKKGYGMKIPSLGIKTKGKEK